MKRLLCFLIAIFLIISAPLPAYASESGDTLPSGALYTDIETDIDSYVNEHQATTAALSVAVFTGNEVLMEKAYGYSDKENSIMSDMDTVFEWGSISKLLVWVSIMQLVEQGKIDLNEDIRTYLPQHFLKKLKYNTPVTVLNLMNHNAGWQETPTDLFIGDSSDVKELGDALRLVEPEQVNKPGTIVAYSNWGTALAGYIVECISGQAFYEYVHKNIFEPLGMNKTALNATLSDNEWVAKKRMEEKCYTSDSLSLGTFFYSISLYPAGMVTGTTGDFVKFAQALLLVEGAASPLFEKRGTLDMMLSPSLYYADGTTARICHGLWTDQLGVPVLWHNGGTRGSTSWFTFDPVSGIGMIILTNQSGESVYTCGLLPLVFGSFSNNKIASPTEDISGMYVTSRSCFKGFAKPYSLVSVMQISSNGIGEYLVTGSNQTITPIGSASYLQDMGGRKQFVIYSATDADGHRILQFPAADYVEVSSSGVLAQYGLLALFLLASLYGIIALIISLIRLLKGKKNLGIIQAYRAAVNISITIVFMIFINVAMELFSGSALINEIRWGIIANAVLAFFPIVYIITTAMKWRKLECSRKEKIGLVMTAVNGLIMTVNVVYWQAYKFW